MIGSRENKEYAELVLPALRYSILGRKTGAVCANSSLDCTRVFKYVAFLSQ